MEGRYKISDIFDLKDGIYIIQGINFRKNKIIGTFPDMTKSFVFDTKTLFLSLEFSLNEN